MAEFYLKILSGNHIGAEIPLEPGRYALGKDDSCDLILTDDNLSDVELIIEISGNNQIRIQAGTAGTTLHVNGEPTGASIQYTFFDIVTSNNLFIALGPADVQWPTLTLPNMASPAKQELSTSNDAVPLTDPIEAELSALDFDQEVPADNQQDDDDELEEPALLARIDKRWLAAIPAALVLAIAVIGITFSSSSSEIQEMPNIPGAMEISESAKAQLGLKHIKFRQLPDNTLMISGYTQTLQDKLELQKLLRSQNVPFNSQIIVMNEMRDNAEMLLKDRGHDQLELELDTTPGSLVLTGYVATSDELDSIVNTLKQEIYGLISVVDQVENQVSRINTLKSMLREKGLIPRLQVVARDKTVILKGHILDEGQAHDLRTVITRFQKKYANNPTIELATKSAGGNLADSQSALALNIRGISMGKVPYVVLLDGSRYLVGAKLSNGYIIEDINLDYLLLSNGTENVKYRLGGNRDGQN